MVAELRGKCKKMNYDTTIVRGTYEVKLHGDDPNKLIGKLLNICTNPLTSEPNDN